MKIKIDSEIDTVNDSCDIRQSIRELEKQITELKKLVFLNRLKNIYPLVVNLKPILIETDKSDNWQISYTHTTDSFTQLNYTQIDKMFEELKSSEPDSPTKKTITSNISFGYNDGEYFIRNSGIKYKIYRNSSGILRIIVREYDYDLDIDEHLLLIEKYSEEPNIAEAFALKMFSYIIRNEWSNSNTTIHLSIV